MYQMLWQLYYTIYLPLFKTQFLSLLTSQPYAEVDPNGPLVS